MRFIKQKLKSSRGASLIVSMLYMLLCAFVGGVVLAAATANAGRTASLLKANRDYIKQRSAAFLLLDTIGSETKWSLDVTFSDELMHPVNWEPGGVSTPIEGEPDIQKYTLAFTRGANNTSAFSRIFYEAAVEHFLGSYAELSMKDNLVVPLHNFSFGGQDLTGESDFWIKNPEGSFEISSPVGTDPITVRYYFNDRVINETEHDFTLILDFGEDSLVHIEIPAYPSRTVRPPVSDDDARPTEDGGKYYKVEKQDIEWDITWGTPVIVKGVGR